MKDQTNTIITATVLLTITPSLSALELSYEIEGGVFASDNISRVQNNPQSDEVLFIGGELEVNDNSSINDLMFNMELQHLQYNEAAFSNETLANIDLNSRWGIVKEIFDWYVDGFYGQQAIDPLSVITPQNLQDIGSFSTGPEVTANFTSTESLTLNYRYTNYYAEVDADYQSNYFGLSLNRRISPSFSVSLTSSYDDVTYEEFAGSDFTDTRYGISLNKRTPTTRYDISLGEIFIDFENGSKVESISKLARISRQLNSRNNVTITYLETVDTGAQAINRNNTTTLISDDVFSTEQAQITYGYNRGGFSLGFDSTYTEQDFLVRNSLDRVINSTNLNASYGIPANLRMGLNLGYIKTDFYDSTIDQVDRDRTATISLEKNLSRELSAVLSYQRYNRTSNTPLASRDIDENVYRLSIRYSGRI